MSQNSTSPLPRRPSQPTIVEAQRTPDQLLHHWLEHEQGLDEVLIIGRRQGAPVWGWTGMADAYWWIGLLQSLTLKFAAELEAKNLMPPGGQWDD